MPLRPEIRDREYDKFTVDKDGNTAVRVVTESDVQIGAVEIKDSDSETRADVESLGSLNGLVVYDITQLNKSGVCIYGDANVPFDTNITLCTYTVPIGRTFKLQGGILGGNADGEFEIVVNGSRIALIRNSASARTMLIRLWTEVNVNSGGIVEIRAKNVNYRKNTAQFEATLNGYTITA